MRVYCIEDGIIYNDRFDAAKKLNCHPDTIYSMCVGEHYTFQGKHYIYYENYLKMTQKEIQELLLKGLKYRKDKRVLCKTTGILFEKQTYAEKYYNLSQGNIHSACNRKNGSFGIYNGNRLKWMWYSDFVNLSQDEQMKIIIDNKDTLEEGSLLFDLFKYSKN